jgi:hypothetical protein
MRDPDKSVGFLVGDVARLLRRNFDRRAQRLGLSQAQWRVRNVSMTLRHSWSRVY